MSSLLLLFLCFSGLSVLSLGSIPMATRKDDMAYAQAPVAAAIAEMFSATDGSRLGSIRIRTSSKGTPDSLVRCVNFDGVVSGLSEGEHGFHIHEFGDASSPLGSFVGSHFAPESHQHGYPSDPEHHVGDFGNITVDANGVATISKEICTSASAASPLPTLHGELSIIGRSLIIHQGVDKGAAHQPTGDAGAKAAVGIIGILSSASAQNPSAFPGSFAVGDSLHCVFRATTGHNNVEGVVQYTLTATGGSEGDTVAVRSAVSGLSPGAHGFHIHEFGDLSDETGSSVGGHYNPFDSLHGLPCNGKRHLGDLGNIYANATGDASYEGSFKLAAASPYSKTPSATPGSGFGQLAGRACIVHLHPDVGVQPTGAAGTKVAMGVIGIKNPSSPSVTPSTADLVSCPKSPTGEKSSGEGQVCLLGSSLSFRRGVCPTEEEKCCCTTADDSEAIRDGITTCVKEADCGGRCIDFGTGERMNEGGQSGDAELPSIGSVANRLGSTAFILLFGVAMLIVLRYGRGTW